MGHSIVQNKRCKLLHKEISFVRGVENSIEFVDNLHFNFAFQEQMGEACGKMPIVIGNTRDVTKRLRVETGLRRRSTGLCRKKFLGLQNCRTASKVKSSGFQCQNLAYGSNHRANSSQLAHDDFAEDSMLGSGFVQRRTHPHNFTAG